ESEGFAWERYVDIFDGGPTMTARTDQVKTVRDAKTAKVVAIEAGGEAALVATGRLQQFRVTQGRVAEREGGVAIDSRTAELLGVGTGGEVMHVGR
ncbi:arginine N-succinyltransferase, partial [Marinobacter sp. 71-i]